MLWTTNNSLFVQWYWVTIQISSLFSQFGIQRSPNLSGRPGCWCRRLSRFDTWLQLKLGRTWSKLWLVCPPVSFSLGKLMVHMNGELNSCEALNAFAALFWDLKSELWTCVLMPQLHTMIFLPPYTSTCPAALTRNGPMVWQFAHPA